MKTIPLDSGGVTQVSDEDFDYLTTWIWTQLGYYVVRQYAKKIILMHIVVFGRMNLPKKEMVDHKDRNPLNNQRENLRAATRYENAINKEKRPGGSSRFIGVSKVPNKYNPWLVTVHCRTFGPFPDEEQAARIRDDLAKATWGEFATLNFPD